MRTQHSYITCRNTQIKPKARHAQAVDNLLLTREAIACVAKDRGKLACFLPKLAPKECGSGAHCHISLQNVRTAILAQALCNAAQGGIRAL